jgi:hypothetical protein
MKLITQLELLSDKGHGVVEILMDFFIYSCYLLVKVLSPPATLKAAAQTTCELLLNFPIFFVIIYL